MPFQLNSIVLAWMVATTLSPAWSQTRPAFSTDRLSTSQRPVSQPSASYARDDILAQGKGLLVTQRELDEAFITLKSDLAAQGRDILESERDQVETELLDNLIATKLLVNRARPEDVAEGKEIAVRLIEEARNRAGSERAYASRIIAMGLTRQRFEERIVNRAVAHQVVERELASQISVTKEEINEFYQNNPDKFIQPEKARAAHILIATRDPITGRMLPPDQLQRKRNIAERIRQRAEAGENFAQLAKTFSDDPRSKDRGGEYTFSRGMMVPEFESAAFSMTPNQISDIVTSRHGYHIIKLYEKIPPKRVELNAVKEEVRQHLIQKKVNERLPEFVSNLKQEAQVKVFGADRASR